MTQIKHCLGFIVCTAIIFLGPLPMIWAQEPENTAQNKDSGFYYTIEKGDTLWDLSEKFYHSQWDWPGLWEMNKEIKNPHWIYPGKKIRVFLTPATPVQKTDPALLPADPGTDTVPPPAIIPSFVYSKMDHVGFIKQKTVPTLGTVLREQDGHIMMVTGDIVYIKPGTRGGLVPDRRYQVFTTRTINEKVNGEPFKGILHIIKAEIRVMESTKEYVTAVIFDAVADTHAGDRIMAYYERETSLTVQEKPAPIDGAIICSRDNTLLVNDHAIAFINRGKQQGIRPGQIYSVLRENRSVSDTHDGFWQSIAGDDIRLAPLVSGRLIVLHTEALASTVMILSSRRDIHPGDLVH
jgi:hypothetical protein